MKIISEIFGRTYAQDSYASLLLTNSLGSFFWYTQTPFSKYGGFVFNEGMNVFKTIEAIRLVPYENVSLIKNNFHSIEILKNQTSESYFLDKHSNAFVFSHTTDKQIELNFDARKIYDMRSWGRYYEISSSENFIIIKYIKKTDLKEDITEREIEYELYTAIYCETPNFKLIDKWYNQFYPYDFERNDLSERAIYQAITINSKKIAVSSSTNIETAKEAAKNLFYNERTLILSEKTAHERKKPKKIKNTEVDLAYSMSVNAMLSFYVRQESNSKKEEGIYAGLPWFFQFWTRDSAISAKALLYCGEGAKVKKIIMNYIDNIRDDGWINNRIPNADLNSADAVGLVYFRLFEFIKILEDKNLLGKYFTRLEIMQIKIKLENTIYAILKNHSQNDLIVNSKKETWMDTDFREGARIEIQALQLAMYEFLEKLSHKSDKVAQKFAEHQKKNLLEKIHKHFFGKYLFDGLNDPSIRPNIFLAYYFYPKMLSKKEWEMTFDAAIQSLWLPWGGFTTIDRSHPEFCKNHTGSTDKSYHKGDSWYFVNNLAAICMHRLNPDKYDHQIKKILEASTNEILHQGILGFHAELSSAEMQVSKGCLAQTWSSATYIELVKEIVE